MAVLLWLVWEDMTLEFSGVKYLRQDTRYFLLNLNYNLKLFVLNFGLKNKF